MSRNYRPATSYQITSHIAVVLLMLIMFVAVGYFFLLGKPDETAARNAKGDTLAAGLATWRTERPRDYRYVVERDCDCPDEDRRPYTITERNGWPSAAYPIPMETSAGILVTEPPRPETIDDVFSRAERAFRSGADLEIRLHPVYGFPQRLVIRPAGDAAGQPDVYEIRDFEDLEGR